MAKDIAPQLGLRSFSCPHCGAVAHQFWHKMYVSPLDNESPPQSNAAKFVQIAAITGDPATAAAFENGPLTQLSIKSAFGRPTPLAELANGFVSRCYSCGGVALWKSARLTYPPPNRADIQPNPDLPDSIRADFLEATQVIDISTRAAAALLRLCIQKICVFLGKSGGNLDEDIAGLVASGLELTIQQAFGFCSRDRE